MFSSSTGVIFSFVHLNSHGEFGVTVCFVIMFLYSKEFHISSSTVTFEFNKSAVQHFKFALVAFTGGAGCFLLKINITKIGS